MWIAHLNKEWNEQRMPLGVLAATLLIVALGFGTLAPASVIPADLEVWFVIVALSGGLLILASDLVTGEHRRGQFGFLLRTPRALRFAFAAKFTALMLGIVALFAIGLGIGTLCEWLVAQRDIVSKVDSLGFAPRVMLAVGTRGSDLRALGVCRLDLDVTGIRRAAGNSVHPRRHRRTGLTHRCGLGRAGQHHRDRHGVDLDTDRRHVRSVAFVHARAALWAALDHRRLHTSGCRRFRRADPRLVC